MSSGSTDFFYSRLPINEIPLGELLTEEHLFYKMPADWHVLITDVKKSTAAVANGLHETVNLVATGSIVAVLNIAYKENIIVPYFFGGDGATFIVPGTILDGVLKALMLHQQNTEQNYNIVLRVGHVPVKTIYENGHFLTISKLKANDLFSIPVVIGDGLAFAEKIIKGEDYLLEINSSQEDELDLSGMQCRWDKIRPPESYDEVVSLLVIASNGKNQAPVFKKVIDQLDKIYGQPQIRKPISVSRLKLKVTLKKLSEEMKVRFGGYRPFHILRTWFTTFLGSLYFRTSYGKKYLYELVDLSDTLVLDGKINTVISGTKKQREELENVLKELEENKEIMFGLFVSSESVMSCYVRSLDKNHVHFVDGSDGGYTKAAGIVKKKLAAEKKS